MNFIRGGRHLVHLRGLKVALCAWSNGADMRLIGGQGWKMVGKVLKGREVLHHLRSKTGFLHWWIRSVKENPGWGILYW